MYYQDYLVQNLLLFIPLGEMLKCYNFEKGILN